MVNEKISTRSLRKFIILAFVILVITTGFAANLITAKAEEAYGDYLISYNGDKSCISILKYNGSDKNVIIPSYIEGIPVKYISDNAFMGNKQLISVVIPETIVEIGDSWSGSAFSDCLRLNSVTFLPGVENAYIAKSTFKNCPSITEIKIPANYISVGDSAFKDCTKLKEVKWEKSEGNTANQTIGEYAFSGCKGLKNFIFPANLISISSHAFADCTLLQSVIIPEGTEYIGAGAFMSCSSMSKVVLPSTIKELGESFLDIGPFYDCSQITSVTIAEGKENTYIGSSCFKNCTSLEEIIIPGNYVMISDNAFRNCTKLKNVIYKNSDSEFSNQTIGNQAFEGCRALEKISFPSNLVSIGEKAFQDCFALKKAEIPEGVTTIDDAAFADNTSLKSVSLPSTLTKLGSSWIRAGVFYNCTALTSVSIKQGDLDAYIGSGTFENCTKLKKITIPGNYMNIYGSAFQNCSNLTSLIYQKSSYEYASQSIKEEAFEGCTKLSDISLPSTLKSIDTFAFRNCTSLRTLNLKEGLEFIGAGAFKNNTSLVTVTLPSTLTTIGISWSAGAFEDCSKLQTVTIPASNYELYIGYYTFNDCTSLKNVYIGPNVASNSSTKAFYECNRKAVIVSKSKIVIGLAKAVGLKTKSPARGYVTGKTLFGAVSISGRTKAGDRLTANTLAVAPTNASVTYKWTVDGEVVSTKNNFVIRKSDCGKKITLTITGKNNYKGSLTTAVIAAK